MRQSVTSTLQTVMYHTHYGMELGQMGLIWPEWAEPPTQDSWNLREGRRDRDTGRWWGREFLEGRAGVSGPQGSFLLWDVHMSWLGSRPQVQTRHSTHTGAGGLARASPALQLVSSCFSPQVEPGVG